jgi:hypothetical protein
LQAKILEFKPQSYRNIQINKFKMVFLKKQKEVPGHQWLMHVILATKEAEIRRIVVQSQPRQIVGETLS